MTYRFLLSWRWAGWLLLAALFASACIGLGNWQMERRNQTVTEIRRVQENYNKTPVPFQSVRSHFETPDPDACRHQRGHHILRRHVAVAGRGGKLGMHHFTRSGD